MGKIPPHAKKAFSGALFKVYQWEQELFDGSTTTFEIVHRDPGAIVIAGTLDGEILLLEEEHPGRPPFLSIPAGGTERGETPLAAAKRELLEETGYVSDVWEEYAVYNHGGRTNHDVHVYIARNCVKKTEPMLDAGEKSTLHHLPFDEFITIATENARFRNRDLALELCRMRFQGTLGTFQEKIFN